MAALADERLLITANSTVWLASRSGTFKLLGDRWIKWFDLPFTEVREGPTGGLGSITGLPEVRGVWTWTTSSRPARVARRDLRRVTGIALSASGDAVVTDSDWNVHVGRNGVWERLASPPEQTRNAGLLRFFRNGDLWVVNNRELALFRGSIERWTHLAAEGSERLEVQSLLRTRSGDLWVGTEVGIIVHRADGTTDRIEAINGTPIPIVTALAEDDTGNVWVGSGASFPGAFRWDGSSWRHFGDAQGLAAPRVHKIVTDALGRIWFLGLSAADAPTGPDNPDPGAFVYDGDHFERWGVEEGLVHGRVYDMAEGPQGERWFATSGGLSRWQDGTWTHWTSADGFRSPRVFAVAIGPIGRVWFGHGANGPGFGYLDGDERPRYIAATDGRVDGRVSALTMGPDGSLWISTEGGITRYRDGAFSTLGRPEGMENDRVWPVLPLDDRVYIGTSGAGVYVLNLVEDANPPPRVLLSEPLVNEGAVLLRWDAIAFHGELAPERIETRYRLDDEPWSPWSPVREVSLPMLPSGRHVFTVQCKSLFGRIDHAGMTAAFRIPPPLYLRLPFVTAFTVWLASVAWLVAWFRRKQLRQQRATELQRQFLERQIQEAQKLESLGVLAGGIAHDFNNLLTVILGHAEMAKLGFTEGDPSLRSLDEITATGERAADLTRQLLAFSRRQVSHPKVLNPNAVMLSVDRMLRRVIGKNIELVTLPDPAVGLVRIDPGQFEQILLNLAINARDAMPSGGKLTLEITSVTLDDAFVPDAHVGRHVLLTVSDTGIGMDDATLARVFEPFFTTKEFGKGSGLGLASCYGIVRQNGGHIVARSELGQGSTFEIYFPVVEGESAEAPEAGRPEVPLLGGHETILLVEDEAQVRRLATDVLTAQGYKVLVAGLGSEALDLAARSDPVDLLVTDIVMPQMSGTQVAEKLRARQPGLKVLYVSGYAAGGAMDSAGDGTEMPMLPKPFTPTALAQKVRELLDE